MGKMPAARWAKFVLQSLEDSKDKEVETVFLGTIKSFDVKSGYGFISSAEAYKKYNKDVFLHFKQIKQFETGDHVTFSMRINGKGYPQAYGLKKVGTSVGLPLDCKVGDEKYTGEIKSFNSSHGYGFIQCAVLNFHFGRDVFINQSQFDGFSVQAEHNVLRSVSHQKAQPWPVAK